MSVFDLVTYRTTETIESSLNREIKEHYERDVFWVFLSFLDNKTLKGMQKQNSVLHIVRYEIAKIHGEHPLWWNEKIFPEVCPISVYGGVRHQSAKKKPRKFPAKENKRTFSKTCLLRDLDLVTYQKLKRMHNTF